MPISTFEDLNINDKKTKSLSFFSSNIIVKKYFLLILTLTIFFLSVLLISVSTIKYQQNNETEFKTTTVSTLTTTNLDPLGPGPWENSTLPDTIIPSFYNLEIRVYPDLNLYEGNNVKFY